MVRSWSLRPALVAGLTLGALGLAPQAHPRVEVGPNILVSDESNLTHIEPTLAVDPADPKHLVGTVTVQHETITLVTAYTSFDGGFSWESSHPRINDGGDPQVAFGKTGTVYFPALGIAAGDTRWGLYVARSEDGGLSWQKPIYVASEQDRPQVAVDLTDGRFSGNVYIVTLFGGDAYKLGLSRSGDDGRSWHGPTAFTEGGERYGNNVTGLLVLSDGTLFIPFTRWDRRAHLASQPDSSWIGFVRSSDGGETFTTPKIFELQAVYDLKHPTPHATRGEFAEYAVDRSAQHRDRIYTVYPRIINGYSRIVIRYSDDRGDTWSPEQLVDPAAPKISEQFNQMVAVNEDGIVGITWMDTRARADGAWFDQYFAASTDGGRTFLPATRVSTMTIRPDAPGNSRMTPMLSNRPDSIHLLLNTASDRQTTGGDYMGLAADGNGAFHALWPDTRGGAFQLYTARIRVTDAAPPPRPTGLSVRRMKTSEVTILFDPTSLDEKSGVLTIPLRVKNLSSRPMYGPITLRLERNPSLGATDEANYATILGATNGKTGPGAEFDLTAAAGSAGVIEPGETTGSMQVRLKLKSRKIRPGVVLMFVSAAVE